MPSTISPIRRTNAFNEGRRAAADKIGRNPYQNPKLRKLWEEGRTQQLAGKLTTPIPLLKSGRTRARSFDNDPKGPPKRKPPFRPNFGGGPNRPNTGGPNRRFR